MGCAAPVDEPDDESESSELSGGVELEIVQFNAYYGGRFAPYAYTKAEKGPVTYGTMEAFAKLLHEHHPNAAVIGMEEVGGAGVAAEIAKRLDGAFPGKTWSFQSYGNDASLSSAMFWRDDLVVREKDFGGIVVGHTDAEHGRHPMVFGGALLAKRGTNHHFGFFTGKLAPRTWGAEGYDVEAKALVRGIAEKMKAHPGASRVIAIDQNNGAGGAAYDAFEATFSQSGAKTPTWESPSGGDKGTWYRFDYIWADWDGHGKKPGKNFVGKNDTMGGSGSDHRAVISTLRIAP